jgi:hypothetical protein
VNSNILINKIYLEVCIPKIFINNGLTLNLSTKKEKEKEGGQITEKNQPVTGTINDSTKNLNQKKETDTNDPDDKDRDNISVTSDSNSSTYQTDNLYYHKLGATSHSSTNPVSNLMNNRKNTFAYSTYNNPSNNFFKNSARQFNSKPSSPMSSLRNGLGISVHNMNMNNIPQMSHLRSPESVRKGSHVNLGVGVGLGFFNNPMYLNPGLNSGLASPRSLDGSQGVSQQHPMMNNMLHPVHPQYSMHPLNNLNNLNNISNLNTLNKNTQNTRRLSESTYDKLKDNPLNMMNQTLGQGLMHQNLIRSPQMFMKVNPEMMIPNVNPMGTMGNNTHPHMNSFARNMQNSFGPGNFNNNNVSTLMNNGFVSPRGFTSLSQNHFLNKNVNPVKPVNPVNSVDLNNPTNSEKTNSEDKNDCGVTSEGESLQKTHSNHLKKNKQVQRMNVQSLTSQFEGYCNFNIFMKSCTPHVLKKDSNLIVRKKYIIFNF